MKEKIENTYLLPQFFVKHFKFTERKKNRDRASFDEDRFKDHNMVNAADPFIVSHLVRKAKTRIHF